MRLSVFLQFARNQKLLVGTLSEIGRDTAFEYADSFLATGINPAPLRLPRKSGVQVYDRVGNLETFGIFEDSLPDGWGCRIQDAVFGKLYGRRPTTLERLAMVGGSGRGALVYEPEFASAEQDGQVFDFLRLSDMAMSFDAGEASDVLPELRRAAGSSGGARPKAYIGFNPMTGEVCREADELPPGFEHWLVKFNTRRDGEDAGLREYEYYRKAIDAGVTMMPSRVIETPAGKFFATKRFDRTDDGGRLHFASAAGLLHADFRVPGDEYAVLFRLTDALTHDHAAKEELFRRVRLNVLEHNRDDHLKNFGFLMDERGKWTLAPFYDFTRSDGPNGWQTLSVAGEGRNPGETDLARLAAQVAVQI